MEVRALIARAVERYFTGIVPLAVLSSLLLAALMMMHAATQNSALFGRVYSLLLLVNVLGIVLLLGMILLNIYRLMEQHRARALGSRLTLRLLVMFVLLSVLPVTVVFVFSIQTLNRGIDNWFDVKVERALDDALLLGRSALEATKQDLVKNAQAMGQELELIPTDARGARTLLSALNNLREQYGVTELTLFSQDGKILASAVEAAPESGTFVPNRPRDAVLAQVRQGLAYANLDATGKSGLQLRVVVPIYGREVGSPVRMLQVLQTLAPRYAKLGESVQSAFADYEKLVYLRGPLKFGFTLTLSLVALLTMLVAVWAAIFSARRVVAPIRDLAEATRAVADGDYRKQIPVTSRDEIGILVESFNEMTRRIHRAQTQIKRSQQEAELQRAYLETVLTHLSSGVLSFDARAALATHNAAAGQILGADLKAGEGRPLTWMHETYPHLEGFVGSLAHAFETDQPEWQAQVALTTPRTEEVGQRRERLPSANNQPRMLIVRATRLPAIGGRPGGHVVVFDDATALIQAQRDAAWGEVARRMAHEIKNPLTPIQLSAERIRHKYLKKLPDEERETLDRATRTIVEQVESLKSLVNAFSDYARAGGKQSRPVKLNDLIRDVVELYRGEANVEEVSARARKSKGGADIVPLRRASSRGAGKAVTLRLELESRLPTISADAGRLRQVLHNLLLNARDALTGRPRPLVRLSTRALVEKGASFVELRVEDNGPGFPEAMLGRLFEPYVTSKEKGAGLGLAVVKRIVEEHGGGIAAENLAEGGAGVTIRLPVAQAGTQPASGMAEARK
ncbi:MAG: HAMP domain-containing protein [Gammaproteobacteria bacterium]|nr:HAMP domain-containing protein [Gammaproteobacteria bacterium]